MKGIMKKVKDILWKKRYILIAITAFWFIVFSIANPFLERQEAEREFGFGITAYQELNGGDTISEVFTSPLSGFCSLNLMAQQGSEADQDLKVELLQGETKLLEETIHSSSIDPNKGYSFDLEVMADSTGKEYEIRITNLGEDPEKGILLPVHQGPGEYETNMEVNGREVDGCLNFSVNYQNGTVDGIYLAMWILLVLASYFCVLMISDNLPRNFAVIACVIGLFYVFFDPFPHALDESTHFFRSFAISQGDWHDTVYTQEVDGMTVTQLGGTISDNYSQLMNTEFSISKWYANRDFYSQSFSDVKQFYFNPYMSSVIPLDHAVAGIGIFIGNLLNLSFAWVVFLGRLCDLAVYVAFCYFALKMTKYYQTILFGVAMLPVALFLAGSCSQDPVLIGASIFFIAICMKHIFEKEEGKQLGIRDLLLILLPMPFICSIKYVIYAPMFLLFLFIPKGKFKNHQKGIMTAIGIALCVVMMGYQVYMLKAFPFMENRNGDVDLGRQVKFVFENLYYTYRNFGTYFMDMLLWHVIHSSETGAITQVLPGFAQLAGIMVVLGAPLSTDKYTWTDKKKKRTFLWILSLVSLVIYGLTIAALYAGFTPVGRWGVDGLQTRYLFPIFPLICVVLSVIPIKNEIRNYKVKFTMLLLMANIMTMASYCLYDFSA